MSSQGNGQPPRYAVRMSQHHRTLLQQRHQEAIQTGKGNAFLSAFRQIVARLHQDPLNFGEPLYRLPTLQLLVRQAVVLPLVVDYAVHEDQPLVFIRGFKVLSEVPWPAANCSNNDVSRRADGNDFLPWKAVTPAPLVVTAGSGSAWKL